MKTLLKIFSAFILAIALFSPAVAQQTKAQKKAEQEARIKGLLESKQFMFQAQNMYPSNGGTRYLNTDYDLRITADTIESYLPYFGEAYFAAGYNGSSDYGIKFKSTDNSYKSTVKKDGSQVIIIKPKDTRNASQLTLTVQTNGFADLSVISINRQQIRFDGFIRDIPKPKK